MEVGMKVKLELRLEDKSGSWNGGQTRIETGN